MVSGNKAGLFNIALAGLAGGASAFAIFAMPQELMAGSIEDIGLAGLMASPIDRLGVMAAAATCASLLAWLALRSCDPPRAKPATPIDDTIEEDWLTQRLASRSGPPRSTRHCSTSCPHWSCDERWREEPTSTAEPSA